MNIINWKDKVKKCATKKVSVSKFFEDKDNEYFVVIRKYSQFAQNYRIRFLLKDITQKEIDQDKNLENKQISVENLADFELHNVMFGIKDISFIPNWSSLTDIKSKMEIVKELDEVNSDMYKFIKCEIEEFNK